MEGIRSFVLFECFRVISLRLWDSIGVFSAVIITEASYFPSPAGISVLSESVRTSDPGSQSLLTDCFLFFQNVWVFFSEGLVQN